MTMRLLGAVAPSAPNAVDGIIYGNAVTPKEAIPVLLMNVLLEIGLVIGHTPIGEV
jgi:hypothetical protein